MNKPQKPELSEKLRSRLNELYKLLRERSWTKQELMRYFGTGERQVREMVSEIAKRRPVISVSNGSGYKVAVTPEEVSLATHAWREIDSRIRQLEERRQPLIEFVERARE